MSNRLYVVRRSRRLTQGELARRAGISRTTVCMLERRGGYPSMRVAVSLCNALGCEFGEVFPIELSVF